ncbi:MAG: hypothetical protein K2O34_07210 [Acetatifactor sp.]|nr:hypothetical protein [Acetatifactor sp.]
MSEKNLMETKEREDTGLIEVKWSAEPYGTVNMEAHYGLYQKASENFLEELDFAREHFQQLYDSFLGHLFDEYSRNVNLDVWNEETGTSERITFSRREELHPYLGMKPWIEIKSYEGKCFLGLSFFEHNRLSIEHGLCAIFDKADLLFMDTYDFAGIVENFKYGYHSGF